MQSLERSLIYLYYILCYVFNIFQLYLITGKTKYILLEWPYFHLISFFFFFFYSASLTLLILKLVIVLSNSVLNMGKGKLSHAEKGWKIYSQNNIHVCVGLLVIFIVSLSLNNVQHLAQISVLFLSYWLIQWYFRRFSGSGILIVSGDWKLKTIWMLSYKNV